MKSLQLIDSKHHFAAVVDNQTLKAIVEEDILDGNVDGEIEKPYKYAKFRKNYETNKVIYNVEQLEKLIETMKAASQEYILLEMPKNDRAPLTATGCSNKEGDKATVTIPPNIDQWSYNIGHRFINELTDFVVQSDENDWEDTYPTWEEAKNAAKEHQYLTGSSCTIINPKGEEVPDKNPTKQGKEVDA